MTSLILASASPRRQQLLAYLGVPFTVKPSPADESTFRLSGTPARQTMDSARAKALAAADADEDCWILAADTVVCVDGAILGKPDDRDDARRMLGLLSGRSHIVTTGLCLYHAGEGGLSSAYEDTAYEETRVWMAELSGSRIEAYLDTGEPWDKAGAYGIQGFGGALIPRVEGCYFNVMGLPLHRTAKLLEDAGIETITNPAHGPGLPGYKEAPRE